MASGDTEGQTAALAEWRKSRGFTPEDMPVVADCIDKIATDYEANRESVLATVAELVKKHPIYE